MDKLTDEDLQAILSCIEYVMTDDLADDQDLAAREKIEDEQLRRKGRNI